MSMWRFTFGWLLELLTLASPKADDAACGVDLGGQGRASWRQP